MNRRTLIQTSFGALVASACNAAIPFESTQQSFLSKILPCQTLDAISGTVRLLRLEEVKRPRPQFIGNRYTNVSKFESANASEVTAALLDAFEGRELPTYYYVAPETPITLVKANNVDQFDCVVLQSVLQSIQSTAGRTQLSHFCEETQVIRQFNALVRILANRVAVYSRRGPANQIVYNPEDVVIVDHISNMDADTKSHFVFHPHRAIERGTMLLLYKGLNNNDGVGVYVTHTAPDGLYHGVLLSKIADYAQVIDFRK